MSSHLFAGWGALSAASAAHRAADTSFGFECKEKGKINKAGTEGFGTGEYDETSMF